MPDAAVYALGWWRDDELITALAFSTERAALAPRRGEQEACFTVRDHEAMTQEDLSFGIDALSLDRVVDMLADAQYAQVF